MCPCEIFNRVSSDLFVYIIAVVAVDAVSTVIVLVAVAFVVFVVIVLVVFVVIGISLTVFVTLTFPIERYERILENKNPIIL